MGQNLVAWSVDGQTTVLQNHGPVSQLQDRHVVRRNDCSAPLEPSFQPAHERCFQCLVQRRSGLV